MQLQVVPQKRIFEGKHADLSEKIIKIFYQVHNELGYGFGEKIYVFNFGKSATFKRMVFDNSRKGSMRWTKK